jgi:hypothetical protein
MLQTVGTVVIIVGLVFMLAGLVVAIGEFRSRRTLGPTQFVKELRLLVVAIADKRLSLLLFTFGILLIMLGGVIAGVAGFTV